MGIETRDIKTREKKSPNLERETEEEKCELR